jgi:hypothetical protein
MCFWNEKHFEKQPLPHSQTALSYLCGLACQGFKKINIIFL